MNMKKEPIFKCKVIYGKSYIRVIVGTAEHCKKAVKKMKKNGKKIKLVQYEFPQMFEGED